MMSASSSSFDAVSTERESAVSLGKNLKSNAFFSGGHRWHRGSASHFTSVDFHHMESDAATKPKCYHLQ